MSNGPQYIILKEGSSESKGREAQRNNIQAAKLIAEIVKTSLGPRGMDKMLVDSLGDVTGGFVGGHCLKVRCRCGRSYGVASLTQRFSSIVETGSCVAVAAKLIAPALKTFAPAAVS